MKNKNTLILSFTLLVVMLGYGMVLPIMPFYIEKLGAGGRELGWLMATYSLMQLICAPFWGVLSDRIGRKPVLAIGTAGYAIAMFLFGLSTEFWMLFAARTLSGILSSATMPTAMAYIGDNSPEKERSGGMGTLGAAMGVGMVLGPLLGGFLSTLALALPFFVGSGLAFLAFWLVILILPEAHAPQAATQTRPTLSLQLFVNILRGPVAIVLLLVFVMSFGMANFQGIMGLYVVDKFGFNTQQAGAVWMVMGAVLILGQGLLTGPLTEKFGMLPLIRAGLAVGALGFVFMILATDFITTLLALAIFTLALSLMGPALNAYISVFAGEHQGTLMGINSATTSLGRVVGPLWAGYIYDINLEFPYLSGAATLLLGLLISLWLRKK